MIRLVRSLLVDLGFHNIREASDGIVAMKKRRGQPCGLVLSDLYGEPMDGLELLRTMRINESLNTIRFIMITASAQPDKMTEAKTLGANG